MVEGGLSLNENILDFGISRIFRKRKRSKCALKMIKLNWSRRKASITLALCAIIAVSSIMILQTSQTTQAALVNPHPGLVGWWRFDEGTGTVAGDSSGNGNNGTISGTVSGTSWVAGQYGQAFNFDGVTNYVSVPNSPSLSFPVSQPFTIMAWFYYTTGGINEGIINKGNGPGSTNYALIVYPTDHLDFVTCNGNWGDLISSNTLTQGWHRVVGVWNGTTKSLYIDGSLDSSVNPTGSQSPSQNTQIVEIGRARSSNYYNGAIDEVQIYNRALSASEVQSDFQQSPDFSTNLLAKVPKGTTQVIITLSWQGTGSINATIISPSQTYTEDMIPVYQKTTYSTSGGMSSMLNIKRLSVSVTALPSDQNWNVTLTFDNLVPYQITVEVQK